VRRGDVDGCGCAGGARRGDDRGDARTGDEVEFEFEFEYECDDVLLAAELDADVRGAGTPLVTGVKAASESESSQPDCSLSDG
jgi:hypothetical protein